MPWTLTNGDDAPEIDLIDTHGNPWRLSDFKGKMVALHFGRGVF